MHITEGEMALPRINPALARDDRNSGAIIDPQLQDQPPGHGNSELAMEPGQPPGLLLRIDDDLARTSGERQQSPEARTGANL
jgi:hypothetical protein